MNSIEKESLVCEFCGGRGHSSENCQKGSLFSTNLMEQAQFVSNFQRQNSPYSNTYNSGWRNHPNFSWNNQNVLKPLPPSFNNQPNQQEKKNVNVGDSLAKLANAQIETRRNV